jgi:hypothetical protein
MEFLKTFLSFWTSISRAVLGFGKTHHRPVWTSTPHWYLDLFDQRLLVAILSPKNVRFELKDPDLH